MRKYRTIPLFVMSTSAILSSIGYGSWIFGQYQEIGSEIVTKPSVAVCYIGTKKYTNLDVALKAAFGNGANDKIFVIPELGFDVNILENHTLEKGDSLIIPYAGENYFNEKGNNGAGFADNDIRKRKSRVCLEKGKVLNVKGDLIIGGITGSNSNPMGQASSSYCEFKMGFSSSLVVSGNVFCYGYIKDDGDSKITMKSGSKMTTPIVFYDYSSAGEMLEIKGNGVFPFKQFDVPSIRSKMVFEYGSSLLGKAHLYGSKIGDINTDVPLIGKSGAFINMSEGSVVDWKFNDSSNQKTGNALSSHTTNVNIYGGCSFGNLGVTIKYIISYPINSKDYYLPIPYGYSVVIKNGSNFSVPSSVKGVKFMPGSSLKCESGGKITFDSGVLFYQNCKASDGTSFSYISQKAAELNNDGTININNGFEGRINTNSSDGNAKLNLGSGYKTVSDCKEGTSKSTYSWGGATALFSSDGNNPTDYSNLTSNTSYKSKNKYWVVNESKEIRSIYLNSTSFKSGENKEGNFDITLSINPSDHDCEILSYHWKCLSSDATLTISGDSKSAHLKTPANSSTDSDKTYTVTCVVKYRTSEGIEKELTGSQDYIATKKSGGCFAKGTKILISDGTYKEIEKLKVGDSIKSFNHETGQIENQFITYIPYHSKKNYQVLELHFDNKKQIKVLFAHGFMNASTRKYEEISFDNVEKKLGQSFLFFENDQFVQSKLISYLSYPEETECYSLSTAYNLNHIVEGALCISDDISGLYNYFDLDDCYKYDVKKKQEDIEKYGLLRFDDVSYFMSKDIYDLFNVKYLSVSIGKGMITMKKMENYIARFA